MLPFLPSYHYSHILTTPRGHLHLLLPQVSPPFRGDLGRPLSSSSTLPTTKTRSSFTPYSSSCSQTIRRTSITLPSSPNAQLGSFPITLLQPTFEKSSKAKALQYAIDFFDSRDEKTFDYVVILDADNVVRPDFLTQLNASCEQGHRAIQCHRCAKNSDNDIAVLDGVSEEINNTLFRRAHNVIGMSSALIGSGMCFDFKWFKEHVTLLSSAVEDRELEALLMKEKVYVKFENDIPVFDEKVSNSDNFQRQRLRWMTGQVQTLLLMLPYIPKAIVTGNINYIDKTIQQALIPRSMLLVITLAMAILLSACVSVWCFKWWLLFGLLCLSLFVAMPSALRRRSVFSRLTYLPRLVWRMITNLFKINHKNKEFIHTTHNK